MRIGILSDTHNEVERTRLAVEMLCEAQVSALIHCGDLSSPPIVEVIATLPSWFVLGNHDADVVPSLQKAAIEFGSTCLGWGDVIELGGRKIGVVHGHMTADIRRVLAGSPEFLLSGHSHFPNDEIKDDVRRINPGALFRADEFTVAVLDLETDKLQILTVASNS